MAVNGRRPIIDAMGEVLVPDHVRARLVAERALSDTDARRGHDWLQRIRDELREFRSRGVVIDRVAVAQHVADDMKALYAAVCQFDGVLPSTLAGVPIVVEPSMGGEDYAFILAPPDDQRA